MNVFIARVSLSACCLDDVSTRRGGAAARPAGHVGQNAGKSVCDPKPTFVGPGDRGPRVRSSGTFVRLSAPETLHDSSLSVCYWTALVGSGLLSRPQDGGLKLRRICMALSSLCGLPSLTSQSTAYSSSTNG